MKNAKNSNRSKQNKAPWQEEQFALVDMIAKELSPHFKSKEQAHTDLMQKFGLNNNKKLQHGLDLIRSELEGSLAKVELDQVHQELELAFQNVLLLFEKRPSSEDEMVEQTCNLPSTFRELLGLSDSTIVHFYDAGRNRFDHALYKDAVDIFSVVAWLDPYKLNVWIALGLANMRLEDPNAAVEAFAMASIVNPSAIYPHIYSAQCYLSMHENEMAQDALRMAMETLQEYPVKDGDKIKRYIEVIKQHN